MTIRRRVATALLPMLAALLAAPAAAAPENAEEVLPNGLRVIYVRHAANPMIASSVVVGAGVIHETGATNGASHFLEHLLFNGTERRTQRELYDEVDRYGAYNNATTREDHTLFSLLIQKEFIEKGLDIQADMLFHSTLPADKFEKEKGIVLEELAKDRNDPEYLAGERFRATAFAGTPLERPVLGSEASIQGLTRDAVLKYYKTRYIPSNMLLVLMGDFEIAPMQGVVRRTFGTAIKAPPVPIAAGAWPKTPAENVATAPLDAGRRYVHAFVPLPMRAWDRESVAVELLAAALADGDDAPLQALLTAGAAPVAMSASLAVSPRSFPWSTLDFEAVLPADGEPKTALDRMAEAFSDPDVLAAARARIPAVRAAARAAEILSEDQIHYYAMKRSSYLPDAPPGSFLGRVALLDEIGGAELDRAEAFLRSGLVFLRASASGPGLARATSAFVPPAQKAPAAKSATAGSGAPTTADEVLGNGLRLHVTSSDDSRVFAVHVAFTPRSASEAAGKEGIADFLHRLFLRGKAEGGASIAARLRDAGASVKTFDDPSVPFDDYYTTTEFSFVRLEMPSDRWRDGIALLGEMVLHPKFDTEDVEAVRREMLDLQKRRAESTRGVAQDAMVKALAPQSAFASPILGTRESISSITTDDLRAFHAKYVTGARTVLTEVGPVPAAEVQAAVRASFGAMPAGEAPGARPQAPATGRAVAVEQKLGKEQASVGLARVFDAQAGDEAALQVAGAILSDKLSFRLREEQGLAYSLSAACVPWGGRMRLDATLATRQENVDKALLGLTEGIDAFRDGTLDAAAVERAANSLRGRLLMRRLTRINQAYFDALDVMAGRPPGDGLRRLDRILEVKPADVKRVASAYFDPGACARVVVR